MRSEWVVNRFLLCSLVFSFLCACESSVSLIEKESWLDINGSEVFVRQLALGDDPKEAFSREAVLVVHGGPVMDHTYLMPHLNFLGNDYQLVLYDQRACGRSVTEVDSATMTLDGFVTDIELIREALGLEKINLMGHSWGGLLAMKYAIAYPERLDKLVLSNTMAPSAADWQKETALIGERVSEEDILARQTLIGSGALQSDDPREAVRTLLRQAYKYQMYDTNNLDKLSLYVPVDYMTRSQILGLLGPDMTRFDLYDDLPKITCPTLLVYGVTEPATSLYVSRMMNKLPDASLKVIERSGHFPFIEEPRLFREEVINFLEDQ